MSDQQRVNLRCNWCPRRRRFHGSIQVDGSVRDFVFRCPRGHAYNVRRLTREERRATEHVSQWVATRWEAGDSDEGENHLGRT